MNEYHIAKELSKPDYVNPSAIYENGFLKINENPIRINFPSFCIPKYEVGDIITIDDEYKMSYVIIEIHIGTHKEEFGYMLITLCFEE